jgi:hypothetical protein
MSQSNIFIQKICDRHPLQVTFKEKMTQEFTEFIPYLECPLCASKTFNISRKDNCSQYPHYKKPLSDLMTWMVCAECEHSFRNGFYTDQAFAFLFEKTHPEQIVGRIYEQQRFVWARVIEKVIPYQKNGTWADIGFGDGALLITAAEYGFSPLGLDIRTKNVEDIRKFGISAEAIDITKAIFEPKASVISMCDVLEHMQFPIQAITSAYRNLVSGGVLLLSMPNMQSPIWKLLDLQAKNPYWAEMEHFHNFKWSRLQGVLSSCGFMPVSYGISERYRACMEIVSIKRE